MSKTDPTKATKDGERLLGVHVAKKTKRFHLDRRAARIAAEPGDPDELLSTIETAEWLSVSVQWLEISRHRGDGPPFLRIGTRCIRYRRDQVRAWLDSRAHACTAEYRKPVAA